MRHAWRGVAITMPPFDESTDIREITIVIIRQLGEHNECWRNFPESMMKSSIPYYKFIYNLIYYSIHQRNADNSYDMAEHV